MAVRVRRALARSVVRRAIVAAVAAVTALTVVTLLRSADRAGDRWGETIPVVVAGRDLVPGDTVEADDVLVRELPAGAVADAALRQAPVGAVVRQPVAAGEPLVGERLAPDGLSGVAALVPAGYRAVAVPIGPGGVPPLQVGDRVDVLAVLPTSGDVQGHPEALDASGTEASHEASEAGIDESGGESGPDGGDAAGNVVGDGVGAEADPSGSSSDGGTRGGPGRRASTLPVVPLVEGAIVVDVGEQAVTIAVPLLDAATVAYSLTYGVVVLTLAGA